MTTLDLKDAYLSVPVHKDSQKFLQFLWRDKCYAFQGLCFGLNTAPRIFTKLLKPVAAFLRQRGVRMILYLDDFLILGSTYQEAQSHTALAVSLLESLGFAINREKSRLIPTQIITFLGFVIDSTVETLSLPQEKVVKVKSLCMKASVTPTMSARQVASLLGTLESCRPAIWQAPLHVRYLQIRMIQAQHVPGKLNTIADSRVEGVQRQQRVEDRPSNDFPISEGVQNRPVCLSPIHPTSPVRQLASGSRGTACGCVDNGLGTLQGLRLSTLQSDSSRPKQTVSGQSRHHTDITSSTMVATTTEPPGRATCPPPELQTPPEGPSRPSEDSSNVPQTTLIVQLM